MARLEQESLLLRLQVVSAFVGVFLLGTVCSGRTVPFRDTHPASEVIKETVAPGPSPAVFWESVVQQEPLIIRGLASTWPASIKWTDEYLLEACGSCNVTMEARYENDEV